VEKALEVQLNASKQQLSIQVPGKYLCTVPLEQPVQESSVPSRWHKTARLLTVLCPLA
jgi:hypothetical protein